MPQFDEYACLDYSGAKSRAAQRKHIVLAHLRRPRGHVRIVTGKDRFEMTEFLQRYFTSASEEGRRIILGIDHCFGFPHGLYETLLGYPLTDWRQWLTLLLSGPLSLEVSDTDARRWAMMINRILSHKLRLGEGPFWGPGSEVAKNPGFEFEKTAFHERRLIEQKIPGTKPVFRIGGAGSVGLQSIYGIYQLARLQEALINTGISLFFWPQDGFDPPYDRHVIVEVYPALTNTGIKSDLNDAESAARWLKKADKSDRLVKYFNFDGSYDMTNQIRLEGWIPGTTFKK